MSDLKRSEIASQHAAVHHDASANSKDATTTAYGPSSKATVIEVSDEVPETTKPSMKSKKHIWALSACLLIAVIFAAFMLLRPKYLITKAQINLAMSLLKKVRTAGLDVTDNHFCFSIRCSMLPDGDIVESQDEAGSRSPTSFPAKKIIPWEYNTSIPAQEQYWFHWLKEHPYTALHLYYMAKLFDKYKSEDSFTFEGYKAISGYEYLVAVQENKGNRTDVESVPAYAAAQTSISKVFYGIDFMNGKSSYSAEQGNIYCFFNAMLQTPLRYARYTFVVSRLHAHDMGWHCTGQELHAALPDIFPCVPPRNALGGSFEEHIGRTVANWALASSYLNSDDELTFYFFGAWVCGGFDPATGTASLAAVQAYYNYHPNSLGDTHKVVRFQDFARTFYRS